MSKDYNYNKMIQSKKWLELRRRKINEHPICEICAMDGLMTPAREVHHIKPVEDAGNIVEMELLMFDYNNLQSLCHDCHAVIHTSMRSHTRECVRDRVKKSVERFKKKYL